MRPATLVRLALAGSRTDTLRVAFTAASSALASVTLLAAATVAAIPEIGGRHDDNQRYSVQLIDEPGLRPGVIITLLLVAVPILALAGQCIRFGSPARDRRLAAVRLAGATPAQAVLIAAGETAASALLGSLVGLGAYVLLRWVLHRPEPGGRLWLPTDVLPSIGSMVLILLIVPVLAALAGAFLLRKVIISPLGVVRRTRDRKPSVLPGVLIIAGVFAPFVIKPLGRWLAHRFSNDLGAEAVIVGAAVLILAAIVGVVLGTGWLTHTTGRILHRYARRPGMLLAGRQLMADPWSGSRTFAALLAAIIIGAGVYGYRSQMATDFAAEGRAERLLGHTDDVRDTAFYFGAFDLISLTVALAMVVAAAGILVALAEGIVSRRRAYAALVATGVPRRTLSEAIAWQTLAPLIPATLAALTVGVGLARAPGATSTADMAECSEVDCGPGSPSWHSAKVTLPVPVPFADLVLLGVGAIAVMALVVGVGLIFLRMSTDLDELRVG